MKKKKTALMGLLLATALTFTACGSGSNNEAGTGNTGNIGEGDSVEPITVRLVSGDLNPDWDNMESDIGKFLLEKTGITMQQEFPVGGSDTDMFALMAASGEYPDMVMAKGSVKSLVDAGALLDLTDLIEQHAPNIKKVYGDYLTRLRYSKDDPAIYELPSSGVGQTYFDAEGGFEIQHQALEELGYPEIKTVKDYENAIKSYIEKNPTTEDGQKRIGLSLNGGEWQILISVTNPAFYATGLPDNGEFAIDEKTFETKLHYQREEEREYFRWLNHMNDIGLLDKESFVQKYDQYKAKIATGRVVGIIDQKWDYVQAENSLKAEGKFGATYARFPVTLDENYQDHSYQGTGYMAGHGIAITKSAKDPVRLIKFLDYLASEEGQILVNWGIEGKHYEVVDGKRVFKQEIQDLKTNDGNKFKKTTGIENYMISARYGDGVKDSTGNYFTTKFPEQFKAEYSEADKKTLAAYKVEMYKEFWPADDAFPERPYGAAWNLNFETGSEADVIFQKTQDIMKKRVPEAILAKPENFDKIWDDFMADLDKAGASKLNEQFTQMVKDRVEFWSQK
ncbi:ABC transporter substrate-binding protein [Paenibacillus sp. BIHB 4019]|uniref:ABC transporter substrate-binding protein n=1 Tax=Paenibacillus sp. BIHB 4019 TaxID=1870819 RepID=A0A1B2DQY2_9BACL|nr:ABC transporter substrate-binding protein [Paenibacillus sp. BIHB 4019]ANY70111.1 ABC transporter substrate-binding protein [Paenibacillus sp. BIHB 4019]